MRVVGFDRDDQHAIFGDEALDDLPEKAGEMGELGSVADVFLAEVLIDELALGHPFLGDALVKAKGDHQQVGDALVLFERDAQLATRSWWLRRGLGLGLRI